MSDPAKPTLLDHLSTNLLRILPQHLLAAGMHRLARSTTPWLKDLLIRQISRRYGMNMAEAEQSDLASYPSFNAFFTRALKTDARPLAEGMVISPADGRVSQIGEIDGESLVQAKGHDFELLALLAGDKQKTALFRDGLFATIYLSPKDYHRVHMPLAGTLQSMTFVPGDLFSVSNATTQLVSGLFARNERVICHFDTAVGPMAVILVGAIFVACTETVWGGVAQPTGRGIEARHFGPDSDTAVSLRRGEELGRFNMGSTVILLFPPGRAQWLPELQAGQAVRLGQTLGYLGSG